MTSILGCGGASSSAGSSDEDVAACDDAASGEGAAPEESCRAPEEGRSIGGELVRKDSPVICVLGDLDELMSFVGMALAHKDCRHDVREALGRVQNDLYKINAVVAGSSEASIGDDDVLLLEKWIDGLNEGREFDFVKPGAKGEVSARIHVCRAVCRRCERSFCKFTDRSDSQDFHAIVLRYLNRLSDLLFALAEC